MQEREAFALYFPRDNRTCLAATSNRQVATTQLAKISAVRTSWRKLQARAAADSVCRSSSPGGRDQRLVCRRLSHRTMDAQTGNLAPLRIDGTRSYLQGRRGPPLVSTRDSTGKSALSHLEPFLELTVVGEKVGSWDPGMPSTINVHPAGHSAFFPCKMILSMHEVGEARLRFC
jgi:hypothetical protein